MLDRTNFTTRTDLELKEIEALCRVRTALETGEISARRFRMDTVWEPNNYNKCGSVGCLGGWASYYLGLQRNQMDTWMAGYKLSSLGAIDTGIDTGLIFASSRFYYLFYPSDAVMNVAKPADGAQAITNFLMGEANPWKFLSDKIGDNEDIDF